MIVAGKVSDRGGRRRDSMAMALAVSIGLGMVVTVAATLPVRASALETARQNEPPTIHASLDTTAITVGDHVRLTVTVEHPAGSIVTWPDTLSLGPLQVLDAEVLEPERLNGHLRSMARFTLTAFELGELEIPSLTVRLALPDSASAAVLSTDALTLTVASVGRDESGQIRGIKGPLSIPRNWLLLWPWAVGLIILAGALWLLRRHLSKRQPEAALTPKTPPRPAHELAYEALDRLESAGLLDSGKIKAHYIEVSEIIRAYIEGRYGIEAMELATHEVMAGLREVDLLPELRQEFEWFFDECDLVKFAKLIPDPVACRAIVPAARRLVDNTKPIDSEPIDLAAAAAGSSREAATR